MKNKKTILALPIIILALVAGGIFATQPVNSLTMDVNPSIEIVTNRLNRVVQINPLNDDAKILLKDFNPKDKNLENTIDDLLGLMIQSGYIQGEQDNFVMITVDDSVESKLINKVNNAIAEILSNKQIEATVLNQSIPKAEKNSNMTGVQHVTQRILEMDDTLDPATFGSMTVEKIIAYSNANNIPIESLFILVVGEADDNDFADVDNVTDVDSDDDADDGIDDDVVGDVDSDADDDADDNDDDADEDEEVNQTSPTTSTTDPATTEPATVSAPESDTRMSAVDARQAVINKFGGIIEKIEYAYDDNDPQYKGEALRKGSRVVFELNARTQNFTKWDTGNDNTWDSFAKALPNLITMNQAANLVIDKSGQSNTFVQKIDFKWDDSEPLYQGEAFNKGIKYTFEIDANSGDFQKWDTSSGDDTWNEKYYNVR